MKHPEEAVALQAIEFWSAVCDEEQALAIEAADAALYGEVAEVESQNFAKTALPEILPVFLELLCQQDEDADDDEWNRSMAAGNCLGLLASTVGDNIVAPVIPFVEAGITQQDWRPREAAVMAFGSILDGPDPAVLKPFVTQALPPLIDMMQNDPSPHVKDTVAWTLGRITDVMVELIQPDVHLQTFITAVVVGLESSNRIVGNCCWSLTNLAEQMGSLDDDLPSSAMSPYYEGVLKALMRVTESQNEAYARTAAYQTISVFIANSANDTLEIVSNVALAILERQEQLLGMQNQIVGNDDRNNWNELQGNFCHVIASVVRKLGPRIEPLADRIMTNLLQLMSSAGKQTTVLEDAFIAVGALTTGKRSSRVKD
jgi:importin subunit beta-1